MDSLLAFVEIPENCKDAIKLMDLNVPSFVKTLRRMMKKLDKGESSVQKPLLEVSSDDSEVVSQFVLIGSVECKKSDVLFAKFPSADGETDIYQLPFIRLSVRRIDDNENDRGPFNGPNQSTLEKTLEIFEKKLDHIDSTVNELVQQCKPAFQRTTCTQAKSATPSKLKLNDSEPKSVPVKVVNKPKGSATSTPAPRISSPRKLDKTIDRVLSYIENGVDLDIGDQFWERINKSKVPATPKVPVSSPKQKAPADVAIKRPSQEDSFESFSKLFNPVQSTKSSAKKAKINQ